MRGIVEILAGTSANVKGLANRDYELVNLLSRGRGPKRSLKSCVALRGGPIETVSAGATGNRPASGRRTQSVVHWTAFPAIARARFGPLFNLIGCPQAEPLAGASRHADSGSASFSEASMLELASMNNPAEAIDEAVILPELAAA